MTTTKNKTKPGAPPATTPKFPLVTVTLSCAEGNTFDVISKVMSAMRAAGIAAEHRDEFFNDANRSACCMVLETAKKYVSVI